MCSNGTPGHGTFYGEFLLPSWPITLWYHCMFFFRWALHCHHRGIVSFTAISNLRCTYLIKIGFSDMYIYTQVTQVDFPIWSVSPLPWRHNERDGVWNHRRLGCLFNYLFRRRSKKTSKFCVTGICEGNPPVTDGFPSQRASNAENFSIWWRHHAQHFTRYSICVFLCSAYATLLIYNNLRQTRPGYWNQMYIQASLQ